MFFSYYKYHAVKAGANRVEHRKVDDKFSVFRERGELFYAAEATSHSCCEYDKGHNKTSVKIFFGCNTYCIICERIFQVRIL